MPFIINCDNRGCCKPQAALLNEDTGEVICEECGLPIKNITSFAKNQLKFFKQVTKNQKKGNSFLVKCEHCNADGTPLLKNDNFFCPSCSKELKKISPVFQNLLREKLK